MTDESLNIKKLRRDLILLSIFKIPMLGFAWPVLVDINPKKVVVKLKLNWRTRNHLGSMYFGAQSVGADISAGYLAYALGKNHGIRLVFANFNAEFHSRPESDVFFVCAEGDTISGMIEEAITTGERITKPIAVRAYTHWGQPEETLVSTFVLGLSLKKGK